LRALRETRDFQSAGTFKNQKRQGPALAFFIVRSISLLRMILSVAPMAFVTSAPIAVFRADLACDFRAGRIADDAACDEADRTKNHGSSKAAECCIRHAFMCAGGGRCQKKTGCNHDTTCKSFHWFVPRVCPFKANLPGKFITLFPIRNLTRARFE
jgi:hypothetical protein